jgi:hypothetical protein
MTGEAFVCSTIGFRIADDPPGTLRKSERIQVENLEAGCIIIPACHAAA